MNTEHLSDLVSYWRVHRKDLDTNQRLRQHAIDDLLKILDDFEKGESK